ncbi:MAG: M20 family metallopeptidase [Pirellulaceae bacterium]
MSPPFGNEVLQTLADLVRINSINPNYTDGVRELSIAEYIEQFFVKRGVETRRQEVFPGRPNIIARIPGRDTSRRMIFEAHMDTVGVANMSLPPWEATIRDGKLFGRGACDTKGGLAAMMHAVASLAKAPTPNIDVWLAATIDEEFSYRGVLALCNEGLNQQPLQAEAAIVAEPTDLRAVIASKGLVRFKIETRGTSAHSAKPHLGVNAIEHMALIIAALAADTRDIARSPHPLLGPPTCNVGTIQGGTQINFVPDHCEIEVDRRMLPHEETVVVLSHYRQLLERVANKLPKADFILHEPMLTDLPLETDANLPAVKKLTNVLQVLGLDASPMGVPFCSDASKFGARQIPSMILGPGSIDQAHAAVEFVDCDQVLQAAQIYRDYVYQWEPHNAA